MNATKLSSGSIDSLLQRDCESPAILAPGRAPLSHRELLRQVRTVAAVVRAAGVGRTDRVAVILPNGPEMAVCFLGVASAATCAPLNPGYRESEFAFYFDDLQPKLLILKKGVDSPARQVAASRGVPVLELSPDETAPAGVFGLGNLDGENVEPAEPDDIALVLHTSGTTSRPKMVPLSHKNLCASARQIAAALQLTQDDRCLNVMPLFHIHGLVAGLLSSMSAGASVICTEGFLATHFFEWLDQLAPTWYTAVPTVHQAVLERAAQNREILARRPLRFLRSSSAPLPPSVMEELEKVFHAPVIEAFGMTEASHQMASNPLPPRIRKPGSVGLPAGAEIAIIGEGGEFLSATSGGTATGEVVIRGEGVTAGYANNPDANREAFRDGWFRTGDLGRLDEDGYLFLSGRTKEIINRGGEKISPREVDEVLLQHPAVGQALAFALPDLRLGEDIAAAVVLRGGCAATEMELRGFVAQHLADFKIPRRIIFVSEIPKGPTGKAQRIGLAARLGLSLQDSGAVSQAPQGIDAPLNPIETRLVEIWKEVLRLSEVGIHSDFFDLGGDSILATQVIARIREELNVELRIYELFDSPTVESLARCIDSKKPLDHGAELISRIPRSGSLPLSHAQRRMRVLSELEDTNAAYMVPKALRIRGKLHPDKLRESLQRIACRHEILRTTYPIQDGIPVQVIAPACHVDLPLIEVGASSEAEIQTQIQELVQEEVRRPIHLSRDLPWRARLAKFNENDHLLLLCVHHICWDGWSNDVFYSELGAFYSALVKGSVPAVPELAIQYVDYTQWEQNHFEAEASDKLIEYWTNRLAGSPNLLDLPTDHPRPAYQTFNGGIERLQLSPELTDALGKLSRAQSATLYMTLLAAFQVLLSRYSNQTDISVGTPMGSRSRKEVENLIGLFINTLVIRCDLSGAPTFQRLLAQVRENALGAYDHHELPFEKLIAVLDPERSLSHSPLFQVLFQLRNFDEGMPHLEDLDVSPFPVDPGTAQFDLYLEAAQTEQGLECALNYNSSLFDRATAKRMLGHYRTLLESVVRNPEELIGKLRMLPEAERHELVVEWNKTDAEFPDGECLHELFEQQVKRTPEAGAAEYLGQRMTYAELNARANQVAHALIKRGAGPDVPVAIYCRRTPELLIGILGILKSGGAYVPLDPEYPKDRLRCILEDAKAPILLAQEALARELADFAGQVVCFDKDSAALAQESPENPVVHVTRDNLAYILFTSGSTGRPKGVALEHRTPVTFVRWANQVYTPRQLAGVLFATSVCFDVSMCEMFVTLSSGGQLIFATNALDLPTLPAKNEVTLINVVPSAMAELIRINGIPASVKTANLAGEALSDTLVEMIYANTSVENVCNLYGPTETSYSTYTLVRRGTPVTIGKPITRAQCYILDAYLHPVPIGVPGELYITGDNQARGYYGRPDLTEERFVPNPFSAAPGARMYRTGDLCRWLPDGNIQCLGRIDHQVKIRGFRIELGEIEAILSRHPAVRLCVVVARQSAAGDKVLVAYFEAQEGTTPDVLDLRAHLKKDLPDYMLPSAFVPMEKLPLTPNGKIDRKALPAPDAALPLNDAYSAPDNETEQKIAEIWQEVLGVARAGRDNNFFDLGGDSLRLMRVRSALQKAFGKEVAMVDMFRCTTIRMLSDLLTGKEEKNVPAMQDQESIESRRNAARGRRALRQRVTEELRKEPHDIPA